MTVFQPIAAGSSGQPLGVSSLIDLEARRSERLVVINQSGESGGKIGAQLCGLGYKPVFLAESDRTLDELGAFAEQIGAILLDWRFEGVKDAAFAEALADKATESGLPVLVLVATDRTQDAEAACRAGLSGVLSMPRRLADLKQALDEMTRRSALGRSEPEWPLMNAVSLLESCKFRFRSPEDVDVLVPIIARLFPEPERSAPGLAALMINAIEHGNLEIGHARKADWVARGVYRSELAKRLKTPPFSARWAELIVNRREDGVMVVIMDEGCGFCWQDLIRNRQAEQDAIAGPGGDGIAMARQDAFDDLRFNHTGNQVTAFVAGESS